MFKPVLALFGLMLSTSAFADIDVPVYFMTDPHQGQTAGTVHISQTPYGLLFTADLHDLSPNIHGFHIHQHPSCEQAGMAAGGHLDPKNTNKHLGPYNDKGHLGDLPALYVSSDGKTSVPVLAPRLHSLKAIKNHALMLHEGGDNYSDTPVKLGGGGSRMLCGVIQ